MAQEYLKKGWPTTRAAHRASESRRNLEDVIDDRGAMASPAFLCRIPCGLIREAENQRDSQELVVYLVDIGGQGRNRTTDTRIFSPLLYQLSYLAAGGCVLERPGAAPSSNLRRDDAAKSLILGRLRRAERGRAGNQGKPAPCPGFARDRRYRPTPAQGPSKEAHVPHQ